jgi:hypothetical protein
MVSAYPFRVILAANSTSTGFTSKVATTTKPSGNGVIDLQTANSIQKFLQLAPFGTDGSNDTFNMRVWSWVETIDVQPKTVWIPLLLNELNITLGNIALAGIGTGNYQADTITISAGDGSSPISSPANDCGANILIHTRGSRLIELDWDLAGAQEAVSMNSLYRFVDQ